MVLLSRIRLPVILAALWLVPSTMHAAERWTIGLTANGTPIEALAADGGADNAPTVLLVGGLQGNDQTSDAVAREMSAFEARARERRPVRLQAIPIANPNNQPLQFPPTGTAYRDQTESHVLWRWIGTHAPDLVLIVGPDSGLAEALRQNIVADVGRIPARRVEPGETIPDAFGAPIPPSEAHQELERRLARSPRELAEQLARVYGREFNQPTYIAAMAIMARLRLGEQAEVSQLLTPYL